MAGPPEGLYSAGQGADVLARQLYLLRVGSDLRDPGPAREAALNALRKTILGEQYLYPFVCLLQSYGATPQPIALKPGMRANFPVSRSKTISSLLRDPSSYKSVIAIKRLSGET